MSHIVNIKLIESLTHDVRHIITDKPANFNYSPGQAVDVSINKPNWENALRAFTFTSLPSDNQLEFTIKTYPERKGVTAELLTLKAGDSLILGEVFGAISYKGPGVFIAGGAGITPFLCIIKQLEKDNKLQNNKLLFANKTKSDIILEDRFRKLFGVNYTNVLSDETLDGYEHGFVTADLIKKVSNNESDYYYICGPDPMLNAVMKQLNGLGVPENHIVHEDFD
ncbi:MAG: flavodoxin reductase [Leptonema sp. (in: Bacteria)]|nr:flavodoxin reductase [Leptonema sp. (in: bacteria)]